MTGESGQGEEWVSISNYGVMGGADAGAEGCDGEEVVVVEEEDGRGAREGE